jgi:hypothetical protein
MKYLLFILLITGTTDACQNTKTTGNAQTETADSSPLISPEHPLLGEWRSVSLKVEIYKDTFMEKLEANQDNWEQVLGIKPIRTFFRADGTFNSEHYNSKDSLVLNVKGTWQVQGNKLYLMQSSPKVDTVICKTWMRGDQAEFDCMVDWDEDGFQDDRYFGVQKKQQ